VIISKFDIVSSNIEDGLNMAEAEPKSIDGEPTPPPPPNPTDIARKVKHDAADRPLPGKAKAAASDL
jgi:hypothetical protein